MGSYSSAKLELLALKWAVCDKFKDYLLGSKFTVLMDNNPLCYVKTSKLGVSQIKWLSNLALFDFDIKYQVGRKNQVADTLSHHQIHLQSLSMMMIIGKLFLMEWFVNLLIILQIL